MNDINKLSVFPIVSHAYGDFPAIHEDTSEVFPYPGGATISVSEGDSDTNSVSSLFKSSLKISISRDLGGVIFEIKTTDSI